MFKIFVETGELPTRSMSPEVALKAQLAEMKQQMEAVRQADQEGGMVDALLKSKSAEAALQLKLKSAEAALQLELKSVKAERDEMRARLAKFEAGASSSPKKLGPSKGKGGR